MAGGGDSSGEPYATPIGLVYVFNLIIGTGALALPRAFQDSGYVLATALLLVSCAVSYINATFVVECLSASNALLMSKKMKKVKLLAVEHSGRSDMSPQSSPTSYAVADDAPLLTRSPSVNNLPLQTKAEYFEITRRTELSQVAALFLNNVGLSVVCIILAIYLFGDLAIYSAVVPKSLMNVICISNGSCGLNVSVPEYVLCRDDWHPFLTRINVYRLMVCVFTLCVGPFVFVGMSKTKYFQMFTVVSRWTAFAFMISFAIKAIAGGQATGNPPPVRIQGFAKLFGITVYAFMCHHSLPAVITPMRRKRHLNLWLWLVYMLIFVFYILLALTGTFAYSNIPDVYTLNFINNSCGSDKPTALWITLVDYFLALFPVMTISMNFPIVGVTLSNNLRALFWGNQLGTNANSTDNGTEQAFRHRSNMHRSRSEPSLSEIMHNDEESASGEYYQSSVDAASSSLLPGQSAVQQIDHVHKQRWKRTVASQVLIPALVIVIPVSIALITDDIEFLASAVGAYAGVGVQFVIPSILVMATRRRFRGSSLGSVVAGSSAMPAQHASPFQHWLWPIAMCLWAAITILIVTLNYILYK